MNTNSTDTSRNRLRSASKAYSTTASKVTSADQEHWDHIQDAALRKKVQNRIAQRSYRQRIKKRIESLEQFRESSINISPQPETSDVNPLISNGSNKPTKRGSTGIPSPVSTSSSHSHCQQSKENISSCSSKNDDGNCLSPCHEFQDQMPNVQTSPLGTSLSFESLMQGREYISHDDHSDGSVWEVGEAMGIGNCAKNFRKHVEIEARSCLEQQPYDFSDPMLSFNESNSLQSLPQGPQVFLSDTHNGKTALHIAAENGKHSTVQLLLSLNSDILVRDHLGRTPLHLAIHAKHNVVIQELLKHMTNLEIRDHGGQTALHAAVDVGEERAVNLLLAAGADVDSKDAEGRIALHIAALRGLDGILRLLLSNGANINARVK